MRTYGAHFAKAIGVRLNLPIGGRQVSGCTRRPYCFGAGAGGKGTCHMRKLRRSRADASAGVMLSVRGVAAEK